MILSMMRGPYSSQLFAASPICNKPCFAWPLTLEARLQQLKATRHGSGLHASRVEARQQKSASHFDHQEDKPIHNKLFPRSWQDLQHTLNSRSAALCLPMWSGCQGESKPSAGHEQWKTRSWPTHVKPMSPGPEWPHNGRINTKCVHWTRPREIVKFTIL